MPTSRGGEVYIEPMELIHRYAYPDRFVSGAVGEPARRVFFVQARQGSRMTNVVCERQQIKVLAWHLECVLSELERAGGIGHDLADMRRPHDRDPLDVPLDEDFRAGTMTITFRPETASLQVELFALGAYRELILLGAESSGVDVLDVVISLDQARDFIARTGQLLQARAPSCPFCAQPIGAQGHICPRSNGYRKPLLDIAE